MDFDKKSILKLLETCSVNIEAVAEDLANGITGEAAVPGANVNSISVHRLIVASNAVKYYTSIDRNITAQAMHYT